MTSQIYETYVPVYDAIPETWEEAKPFLVENLKKISEGVNIRTIGWHLDEELISGNQFIPGLGISGGSDQYRTILRKVIDTGALVAGVNAPIAHGITVDNRFTLIDLWVSCTNSVTLTSTTLSDNNVTIVGPNINITSPGAFDRSFAFVEYIQEL